MDFGIYVIPDPVYCFELFRILIFAFAHVSSMVFCICKTDSMFVGCRPDRTSNGFLGSQPRSRKNDVFPVASSFEEM